MKINNISTEHVRPERVGAVQREADRSGGETAAGQPGTPAVRSDRVQISDAGRALAAAETETGANGAPRAPLTPERAAEIRERIMSGAYNSLEVVEQVARRMLSSGDI